MKAHPHFYWLRVYCLEVEVETEEQVSTAQVQTEFADVVVIAIRIQLIPANETKVRNEADVVSQAHSQTGLEANGNLIPIYLRSRGKVNTTIDEEAHLATLHECVTGIGIESESALADTLNTSPLVAY